MYISGAEIIIKSLLAEGVDTVFGYPGAAVLRIYDALYRYQGQLRHVLTAHEQGAAHAADGYARASGNVGVVIATSGPGAANLVTGIATAQLDSIPLVAITGNVSTSLLGKDSFQEVDIFGITLPITKHNYIVRDVRDLSKTISEAFALAKSGRPGPVLIDIPQNVQGEGCEYRYEPAAQPLPSQVDEQALRTAASLISNAQRPYIFCGGGAINSGAGELICALSRRIDAPIGMSMMGLGAVPAAFSANLGMTGMHGKPASVHAMHEADCIIAAGVRFSERATGSKAEFRAGKHIVHLDIDPAEINKNICADAALIGDLRDSLTRLNALLPRQTHPQWQEHIQAQRQKPQPEEPTRLTPQYLIAQLAACCDADTRIATDVGQHQMWVAQEYPFQKPRTLLTSGGLGTMGFGLGAAIGGCLASEHKTVLCTGDGSFAMNAMELATAVREKLPLVIVIFNNGALGMVRQWQDVFYDKRYSQSTPPGKTDFIKLAEAYGAKGLRVTTKNEVVPALEEAFACPTPFVLDCRIDEDEKVFPMIPPGGNILDIIWNREER